MSTPARWRAVDEHGFVLDILLQRHRDTEAAKTFLIRLLGEYDVPEVIHTDQLRSYGAAVREISSLVNVDQQQVISTARRNNLIEQFHRPTRREERSWQGFKRRKRAQEFLSLHARIENLHHHSRTSVSATTRRSKQQQAFWTWSMIDIARPLWRINSVWPSVLRIEWVSGTPGWNGVARGCRRPRSTRRPNYTHSD